MYHVNKLNVKQDKKFKELKLNFYGIVLKYKNCEAELNLKYC